MTIAPTEPVAWRFSLHDAPGWQYSSVDPALHLHATEAVIEPLFSLAAAPVPSPHGKEVREAVARAIRKHVHGSTTIGADGFSRPGLGVVGVDAATDAILALLTPARSGWRPIESAPRDGTEFQAWWSGEWHPRARFDPEYGSFQLWGRTDFDTEGWEVFKIGSHWMPLPVAPSEGVEP